jgi:hypothetical protein
MPETTDVLKCQLKPLVLADYTDAGIAVTQAQVDRLKAAFPTGVCDYSKPGIGQRPPVGTYLDFADGPGGEPLRAEPASRAVAGAGPGRSGSGPGAAAAAPGSLPSTGLSAALPVSALAAVALAAGARRRRRTAELAG